MTECVHRMNLKGPWFYEWLDGPEPAAAFLTRCADRNSPQMSTSRVRMPTSWLDAFGAVAGTVLLRRRFGRPSNLEAHERVYVTLDCVIGDAEIAVNGELVAAMTKSTEPHSFDVTDRLDASNELSIKLTFDGRAARNDSSLLASVAIEIHQQQAGAASLQ
ncbi:hypothetical protein GC176_03030 [bacterium]|nr:hypothetical protein [bacterium]